MTSVRLVCSAVLVGSKASGKCSSALSTGIGVSPPIAQSDPSVMTWQRSSRTTRLAACESAVVSESDAVDDFDPTRCTYATGRALAARLLRAELHCETSLVGHVDSVVEHHNTTVADHRFCFCEGLVVHRQVETRGGQVGAEGSAYLHRVYGAAGASAAAVPVDEIAERYAERGLDDAALLDVAG